ncbi:MAG TPA: prolyl oligopeptidase family serine peptidase, partial [Vicinamibacteria bacterium]|nr:prolyl oligopeptidase family serine peptidase [Vicinamibacteria bacterium]
VTPSARHWEDVVPHRKDVLVEDFELFRDFLVLIERYEGRQRIRVIPWEGTGEHEVSFEEPAYHLHLRDNFELATDLVRLGYTSLRTPRTFYDYDMRTRQRVLLKREPVVGDFDPDDYVTERLAAAAPDGAKVPISLVYRKDTELSGKPPLVLYGYGSYGINVDASFSSARLSLLDRGFVYAIAHVRGGQMLGRHWYDSGRLLQKRNTFTDYIAAAEHLVSESYVHPEKLFGWGGSAGGLLLGAVINMKPELFHGVVAHVPFVDVVTTMLDDSIPLTTSEYDEWGDPRQKLFYDYMLSFSPYDNVERKDYPHLLVTAGYHDPQVPYWEPAKWVAKLRAIKTDSNRLLLKTNMEAGHHGESGRFQQFRETALCYAFLIDLAG